MHILYIYTYTHPRSHKYVSTNKYRKYAYVLCI
jgi:hypothetical protein